MLNNGAKHDGNMPRKEVFILMKTKYRALGMAVALSSVSLLALALDITPALAATAMNPYTAIKLNGASHPTVYLQRNGTMHAISSEKEFYDLGYSFSEVHRLNLLPDPVGKPVELFRQVSHPQVYILNNGTLHWISSAAQLAALGYSFSDVYKVSALPYPVGAPETTAPTAPAALDFLSGYPYLPAAAGVSKTVALYALTSVGTVQTGYNGQATVQWSSNGAGLKIGSGASAVSALNAPVTVTFHQGVAQVSVTTGTGSVGSQAELLAKMAGSAASSHMTLTVVSGDPSTQAGYRVYTPNNEPVTGLTPIWDNTSAEALQIKPVNGWGDPVAAQVGDTVSTGLVTGEPGDQAFVARVDMSVGAVSAPITFNDEEAVSGPTTVIKSPGVLRVYASVPGRVVMTSAVNQATGVSLPLSAPAVNNSGDNLALMYTQSLTGIAANQTYLVTVAFDNALGTRIIGSPLNQFVPAMWNTPLSSAADFGYDVNSVPGQSSGAYVGPLMTASQGTATFVFHSGSVSPAGAAIELTLNTPPNREWRFTGQNPVTQSITQVLINSY